MAKYLTAIGAIVLALLNTHAIQAQSFCGNELIEQEIARTPHLKAYYDEYHKRYTAENLELVAKENAKAKGTSNERYIIPVVFHIVVNQSQLDWLGKEAGVIDRINTQLAAVNEDFSMTNLDISKVPAAFKNVIGNANIAFELAKQDGLGNAKIGIDYRIQNSSFTGFAPHKDSVKKSALGGIDPWDNSKFLNIWVTAISPSGGSTGQILGYGYNPMYAYNTYNDVQLGGIVLHYETLGRKSATVKGFYSHKTTEGRTLTHELGHFFNIWHIWGKSVPAGTIDCSEDDGISDTPLQAQSNSSCPGSWAFKQNCAAQPHPGGEMYMNFMDYSGDSCVIMFTKEQVARMRSELAPGGDVHTLSQNPELGFWPANISKVENNNTVTLAPNPSTGIFNIAFIKKFDNLEGISVTNSLGQTIRNIPITNQNNTSYHIDISTQPKGVYMVQLHFDQGVITRKVVLQ